MKIGITWTTLMALSFEPPLPQGTNLAPLDHTSGLKSSLGDRALILICYEKLAAGEKNNKRHNMG